MKKEKPLLPRMAATATLAPLLAPWLTVQAQPSAERADQRPNIILFMVDDMGWQDTSVPFGPERTPLNERYETPNMERLASEGMLFSQAYAAPISSPSRCSLMTGSNAARHRVTNWTLHRDQSTDLDDAEVSTPDWNYNGISQVSGTGHTFVGRTFVDLLRASGYHTIHVGKAHWGAIDTPGEQPEHFGFEVNIGGHAAGGPATYLSEQRYGHDAQGHATTPMHTPHLERYWDTGTFLTEALTQEALHALDKARQYGQPFYLYLSHYAVHIPIDRDPRYYQKYLDRGLSAKEAAYASLVEGMDKSLGDILAWLDRTGEARNTIVLFMSDNGGYATGSYWRDEPLYTQNAPLRSGKGSLLEGGIREPMIVRWPGHVAPRSRCDRYVMIEDFFPTLIWNYPNVWGNEGPGISLNCAIRRDQWKLIYNYKTREKELYDIEHDLGETHNLAAEHPNVVRRLSRELGRTLRRMDAQRPIEKASGKPCPWPDE